MFITTALSVVIYHCVLCIVIGVFGTTNVMFKLQMVVQYWGHTSNTWFDINA